MSDIYQVPLTVRGYECGPDRTVPLPVVLSYMEHCRWGWITVPELGLVDGLHSGHFFVVHRQTVALARTFGIGTPVTVRAALRSVGRVKCDVDQDLVRDDGVLLARARITAVWLGPTGRMARIPDRTRAAVTATPLSAIVAAPEVGRQQSFLDPPQRIFDPLLERLVQRGVPDHATTAMRRADRSACDMFGHVNGSNYLRWFEDAFGRSSERADIEYRGQAVAGDSLAVRSWEHGPGQTAYALQRGDDTLCRAVLTAADPVGAAH